MLGNIDLRKILISFMDMLRNQDDTCWNWCPESNLPAAEKSLRGKKLITYGPPHINRAMEICVCLQGHSYLQLTDRTVVLEPGQFFVVPARMLHNECIPADEECLDLWLNMRQDQGIRTVISGRNEEGEFSILYCRAVMLEPVQKKALLDTLHNELNGDGFGAQILVKNRMIETLIAMVRQLDLEDKGLTGKQWQQSVVSEVEDYLHHHCTDRIELQDLADHMAMSVKHLNRIFKDVTGTTIINYANQVRLEQAKYYLSTTTMKIKDIAELLNYYDQYHFGRIFKKNIGVSPMEFRKTHQDI